MSTNSEYFAYPTQFKCSLIREETVCPNLYNIKIFMHPDGEGFALGFKKIKHFIKNYLDQSIIIEQYNPLLKHLQPFRTNTIQLPQDPHDYFFTTVLFHKLNSISQDYFTIYQIIVDSELGDHVNYSVATRSDELNTNNWWNQSSLNTNDIDKFPSWDDVKIGNRFDPKVVQGGRNENRSVR